MFCGTQVSLALRRLVEPVSGCSNRLRALFSSLPAQHRFEVAVAVQIVTRVAKADGCLRSEQADCSQNQTARQLKLAAEHMLDPNSDS